MIKNIKIIESILIGKFWLERILFFSMITWWSQWEKILRFGEGKWGGAKERKAVPVIAPVGGHLRRSPAVRQAPYCVGFSCFCSLKQLPNSLKSQWLLGTDFWLIFYTLVSHNVIRIPENQESGGAENPSGDHTGDAHGGRKGGAVT